jgi:hypothetical protein
MPPPTMRRGHAGAAQRGVDDVHRVADRAGHVDQRGHVAQRHVRGDARRPQAAGDVELAHEARARPGGCRWRSSSSCCKPAQAQRMLVERREHDRVDRPAARHRQARSSDCIAQRPDASVASPSGGSMPPSVSWRHQPIWPAAGLVGPLQAAASGSATPAWRSPHRPAPRGRRSAAPAAWRLASRASSFRAIPGPRRRRRPAARPHARAGQAHCPSTLMLASRISLP